VNHPRSPLRFLARSQEGGLPSQQRRYVLRCAFALLLLLLCAQVSGATPFDDYHRHLQQAISALETLAQADEDENEPDRTARVNQTLSSLRMLLPAMESVEWDGTSFKVDNSWLHQDLGRYERTGKAERVESLARITERLLSIAERVAEIKKTARPTTPKTEANRKLAEILQRPEYGQPVKAESAFSRLWRNFWHWIESLLPKQQPLTPGSTNLFTAFAQIFVILLALGVVAYVLKMLAPRLFRKRSSRKKVKQGPRIVLGERLEPEQTAGDLLAEAEALARRGELRPAIRRAYIALLVELGERKIISLAQHKTNRDYLRSVRNSEPLYANVKVLTESFERHWYGLAGATEADWLAFRRGYKAVISDE
jgi:uncharacterized protein DUF4129